MASQSASFVGIDFGTTNSTLAIADAAGQVALTHFDVRGKTYDTFRSVIYFDPDTRRATCGIEGIFAYLDGGSSGRFIQSVKSYLASKTFRSTNVYSKVYTLEQLITLIVAQLKAKARQVPDRVVVGRPVHFVNDDEDVEGDAHAESRLRAAIVAAGFGEVHFEMEPVAAAYQYESTLAKNELVLIADFGGGTTDLCLIDAGPDARKLGRKRVRATDGVGLAGDAFDQRIIQHAIAPQLGRGSKYRVFGGDADVPLWLYSSLARWHLLSFLKSPNTMQILDTIVTNAYEKRSAQDFAAHRRRRSRLHLARSRRAREGRAFARRQNRHRFRRGCHSLHRHARRFRSVDRARPRTHRRRHRPHHQRRHRHRPRLHDRRHLTRARRTQALCGSLRREEARRRRRNDERRARPRVSRARRVRLVEVMASPVALARITVAPQSGLPVSPAQTKIAKNEKSERRLSFAELNL